MQYTLHEVTTHSIKTQYTKNNSKGHPTTMNTKQINNYRKYKENTTTKTNTTITQNTNR
jgi:hypothetical protein